MAPALSHPVRRRLLRRFDDGRLLSANDLANDVGLPRTNVAYHLKVLRDHGLVWIRGTVPVRGTHEAFHQSLVAEDVQVTTILTATEAEDES